MATERDMIRLAELDILGTMIEAALAKGCTLNVDDGEGRFAFDDPTTDKAAVTFMLTTRDHGWLYLFSPKRVGSVHFVFGSLGWNVITTSTGLASDLREEHVDPVMERWQLAMAAASLEG